MLNNARGLADSVILIIEAAICNVAGAG